MAPTLDTPSFIAAKIAESEVAQKPDNILVLLYDDSSEDPTSADPILLIAHWTGLTDRDSDVAAELQRSITR